MAAYFNEIDPAAAHLLRCLIKDGVIAPGDVDERSIKDVQPEDLRGYDQVHFFAGGGLWSVAARLAGWPDDRPLWTGSCPCQPFSVAGKGAAESDPRHLWPDFFRLLRACRPPVVMGEQVAGAAGYKWFDGVAADLEGEDYACRAVDIPACAVDAPHIRQRLYWCAVGHPYAMRELQQERTFSDQRRWIGDASEVDMVDANCARRLDDKQAQNGWRPAATHKSSRSDMADAERAERWAGSEGWLDVVDRENAGRQEASGRCELHRAANGIFWSDHEWRTGADGKSRRAQPGVRLLVDGFPNRVAALRIAGNAIVPQIAAEVIRAFMDVEGVDGGII